MPLSDWRDDAGHLDGQAWDRIYNLEYLRSNVEGGEGFDWYYHSPAAEAAQVRTPISDGAFGEPWVWRYKDIRGWWENEHFERIGGVRQANPTPWMARSKPVWFTELGCAAVDKGTNEPNKFIDPKSSESRLPKFSNGRPDDLIQRQYLRAVLGYWADNNPVSDLYAGPMIDLDNAYVWAWDARPYPAFPNNRGLWSDGDNHRLGHWLNGRAGTRTLASVVEEVCARSDLSAIDTSALDGIVRGYLVDEVGSGRAALQPLMLRHGFDAVERDGVLAFRMRDGRAPETIPAEKLAESGEIGGLVERTRGAEAETTGRVRVRFVESGSDHGIAAEEAVLADEASHAVASKELAMALTRAEGRQVAERWLTEARVSRDTARFALPPSLLHLGAGDVVRLEDDPLASYRIDRIEQAELQLAEAVRIEPAAYQPSDIADDLPGGTAFAAPVPVLPLFLDLPLMRGDEVPYAPHLAVTAQPWPGAVAVYASASDDNYAFNTLIDRRSVVGLTETALGAARAGLWDEGPALQVRLLSGALESRSAEAVLNGANVAAIGDGTPGNWELFQFRDATLIGPETWWLTGRLRGQLGSDGLMPASWPAGSWFVLLDGTPRQIDLASGERRIARHYRIGAARRGVDDPSYRHRVAAFDGNGLRPYAPAHLRLSGAAGSELGLTWVRRTRIDGDSWDLPEVPLGEETEQYQVRVRRGNAILREASTTAPQWTYAAAAQAADGAMAGDVIEVAQVSARYGAGPFRAIAYPV
ncbi:MAG: glycoside hydrolase TIM-barrel-like domain-containing protein, partial [Pseudooceanicola sp.]|nr:glycoside hydrolase TIM-barrel-like domain-containing protein [Pseudooceanicola sp.]